MADLLFKKGRSACKLFCSALGKYHRRTIHAGICAIIAFVEALCTGFAHRSAISAGVKPWRKLIAYPFTMASRTGFALRLVEGKAHLLTLCRTFALAVIVFVFSCTSAYSYESSFPFPFEFGHSSDIYLDVKKPETKATRVQNQAAQDILRERGIKTAPEDFLKYIKKDDVGLVKLMLDAGFDPNSCINGNYAIYWASKYNRRQIVYLLLEKGASPNNDIDSCVRPAILNKNYELAKLLVENGANVNYVDTFSGESLLLTSLKKKQYDIARLLLQNGAKPDADSYKYIKRKDLERKIGIFID